MGGGLMQLVAYGAQDIYLTGNPQITFFKVVYRRHTNFSMEAIQQTINGTQQVTNAGGQSGTVTISRNGDLVHKVYVHIDDANVAATGDGNDIVREVELEIGGQKIDKHTNEYMKVMNELSTPESKAIGLKALTGGIGTWGAAGTTGVNVCMVPLQFWFCRNPGLALPLIALQYHEVKLKFTWGALVTATSATCNVFCDYIYLDTDERRRFAQQSHEYLIEQVQTQSEGTAARSYKLNFNHPVKELVWTSTVASGQPVKLSLNGHDRFSFQPEEYFQLRQPLDHHSAVPRQNLPTSAQLTSNFVTVGNNILAAAMTSEQDVATAAGDDDVSADNRLQVSLFADTADNVTTAFDNTATVANTGYCVTDDVGDADDFIVGRVYQITFGNGTKNALGNGRTLTATLTGRLEGTAGDAAGIEVEALTTVLFFDKLLVSAAAVAADAVIAAGEVVINGISLLTPDSNVATQARTSSLAEKINVYSFALKPEEHQPSGTCNFSRIDTAKLEFSADPATDGEPQNIYAVNYNVLRIMSGMGGLAYSN